MSLKRVNEQLEDDIEQLVQDVSYEKHRCNELIIKLDEHKKIVYEFDTTLVEELNHEILDANEKCASLEKLKLQLSLKLIE